MHGQTAGRFNCGSKHPAPFPNPACPTSSPPFQNAIEPYIESYILVRQNTSALPRLISKSNHRCLTTHHEVPVAPGAWRGQTQKSALLITVQQQPAPPNCVTHTPRGGDAARCPGLRAAETALQTPQWGCRVGGRAGLEAEGAILTGSGVVKCPACLTMRLQSPALS